MKSRLFRSLSDSPNPAKSELESEIEAQKAAFFASGGIVKTAPLSQGPDEVSRFNGKNHEDIGKRYEGANV